MSTFESVRKVIADTLYVEPEEVTREASLMQDLGAESLDFLDIIFQLEKEFGIEIPRGEIEKRARGEMSEEEFAVEGKLTPAAIAKVRELMPEVDPERLSPGLMTRDIPSLFTAATFERLVNEQRFGSAEAAATGAQDEKAAAVTSS